MGIGLVELAVLAGLGLIVLTIIVLGAAVLLRKQRNGRAE